MIPLFVSLLLSTQSTSQPQGEELLTELSQKAVSYFWEQTDPESGFTLDRASNTKTGIANNATISSIAATGYALSAFCIGSENGWVNKSQAKSKTKKILTNVLDKLDGYKGWYYHFVDVKTGKREWNCELSSIDSGLLFAGIHMAEGYWQDPEIQKLSRQIMSKVDWKWFLTDGGKKPNSLTFSMGWSPEKEFLDSRWDGFYEHMFLYIIALGNDKSLEPEIWTSFRRSRFSYHGIELMHGASLFIHQMSQAYLPMKGKRDVLGYDYWVEGRNATLASRTYTIENPNKFKGYSANIWGLSACDVPDGYAAPGAPAMPGETPFDNGTLAPAAAVASVMYTPELSISAAEAYIKQYPKSYGRYGFTTGINPTQNWQSPDVIGIDLGQMMLAIENHQNGNPHRWMMANQNIQLGMERAGFRNTAEGPLEKRKLYMPPVKSSIN